MKTMTNNSHVVIKKADHRCISLSGATVASLLKKLTAAASHFQAGPRRQG
jgi:hypothetical protein